MSNIIQELEKEQMKENVVDFNIGDTIKVFYKITEGKKERVQPFEGVVTRIHGGGVTKGFTVRKVVGGVGVEKTYMLHSPKITEITVLRQGKVRKARLFYLRDRIGSRASKIKAKDPRFN
ncbi:MAG: 50S ribosomal protein L19 [Candidatus Margulisbacteria bacterium]|nr:50S ribosomal protein L19 [Candidatus Margulisiibacteriota bacterium]